MHGRAMGYFKEREKKKKLKAARMERREIELPVF